jgi:putative tricarboxylic transport membrane protein
VTTSAADPRVAAAPRPPVGELVFAAAVAGLGAFALARAHTISEPVTAGSVGPRLFPYVVGAALVLSGVAVAVGVLRGRLGPAEESEDIAAGAETDWATVGALVGIVALHIVLIVPLGWPVAAAVLFTGCAWTLGARPRWRAAVIGSLLALVLQALFAGGLGVSLPAGPLLEGVGFLRG